MDYTQSASNLSRLWYQATGRSWEAQAEGGPKAEFDTKIGTDLNDLKVEIQYQQDLHGYDNPWPAGGGKNKFNINAIENKSTTNNSIVNDDGVITVSIGEASPYNGISSAKTLAQLAPGLEAGKTYMLTVVTTGTAQIYLMDVQWESGTTQTLTEENLAKSVWLYAAGKGTEATITAIQIEEGTTQTDPEPYENICPITGYDEAEIYLEHEYDAEADPRYTIDLDDTRYSGTLDVTTGELTVTYGEIASYNGETLPGVWVSSLDVYAEGTTPTTGAQVVYELAEPLTVQLDPTTVTALTGHNTIWCNTGDIISVDYNII